MSEILKSIGKFLASVFLTKSFLRELAIFALERAVKESDNTIDDEILTQVKKSFETKTEEKKKSE